MTSARMKTRLTARPHWSGRRGRGFRSVALAACDDPVSRWVGSSVVLDGQPLIAHMTTHSACGNATRVMACFGPYSVWQTDSHRWPLADK